MILLDSFRAELVAASCANLGPILGIDTAGPVAHLGLIAGGKILDFRALPARSHASSLPDAVIAMLADHSLNMRDISAIAVGTGPGSFTGVRIGLAYAKGIAIGADIALAGVGSLDSIAATALDPKHVNLRDPRRTQGRGLHCSLPCRV
jgi:tRNA threonylcarbamoyladenosine biosynthesis protein TsaB